MPPNTIVGINAWVTQHDPSVFPDPESFIPERWLEASEDELRKMDQAFFAFGAESRTCIGRYISLMEMAKVVPQLLREFEVRMHPLDAEWKCRNVWFVQQTGFICRLTRREKR
jgi:cytochrome P450